jgi:hypothetical protein
MRTKHIRRSSFRQSEVDSFSDHWYGCQCLYETKFDKKYWLLFLFNITSGDTGGEWRLVQTGRALLANNIPFNKHLTQRQIVKKILLILNHLMLEKKLACNSFKNVNLQEQNS